ncbi:MAG: T9SS type B sorting domain-containing protein [Crocinitomicaceae bacterium]|nr:T9SS type B sorting domain-containing protein [Crocinitomicaceae bacterium]
MIKPFLSIVFIISFASSAQNLVPNGSFEEYSDCPYENELGSNGQFERCNDWYYITPMNVGTPDYFNSCNNSMGGMVGVPNNFWGYQQAYDGNGYIGFVAYDYSLGSDLVTGKEIASSKLDSALKPCTKYRFSMYVSLSDKSPHGCSGLGILLSDDDINFPYLEDYLSLTPTLEFNEIVLDTSSWTKLEGVFVAEGGETVLNIGYFSEVDTSEVVLNDSVTMSFFNSIAAAYYIDSVSLVEVETVENCIPQIPNVFTPNDDAINNEYSIEALNISEMVIFNRWGKVIVTLNKDNPNWDGTFEGKPCAEGSYFYRASFENTYLTGFIELIR